MKEIWRDIPDYKDYQVSNLGRVKNNKNHIMKQIKNSRGYLRVTLHKKKIFVHRLVAQAFILNPQNKPQINHLDCVPTNNKANNLEWTTQQENVNYMIKLKRNKRTQDWLNNLHKSQEKFYKKVKGTNKNGDTIILNNINEAKKYGMSAGTICACCKKRKYFKTYKGFTWEYIE